MYSVGLTDKQKEELNRNIERTKKLVQKNKIDEAIKVAEKRPQPKNPVVKESSFVGKLKKIYDIDTIPNTPSQAFASLTGLPIAQQKEILKRGAGAFLSAGSRRGVSSIQWSKARLYAFVVKTVAGKKTNKKTINQDADIYTEFRDKLRF